TSPSCPNVIIEALAAGLPGIAYDTGAVKELLAFNRDLLAATPDRLLHGAGDFEPRALADCRVRFAGNRASYRQESEGHRRDFSEEKTLGLYLEAMKVISRKDSAGAAAAISTKITKSP